MLSLGDRYPNHVFTAPRYHSSSAASLDAARTRAVRLQIARSYRVRSEADLLCLCFGLGISPARGPRTLRDEDRYVESTGSGNRNSASWRHGRMKRLL